MDFCKLGLEVIELEARAVQDLLQRIDAKFDRACKILLSCKGRIIVTGMGKSGHIGKKIASTLSSTGSPAFFMHPAEASHGDFGMITEQDVIIAISNSGHTEEIVSILPLLKRQNIPIVAICGNPESVLAKNSDAFLDVSIRSEACPLGLAPTTSTTVALVMGDALAITLLQARGFSAQDFARSHPKGSLGKRLLLTVDEIWVYGNDIPIVEESTTIRQALLEVTNKKLGMTCVVKKDGTLAGIYTDGDVRRTLNNVCDINNTLIKDVMSVNCLTISPGTLAYKALSIMQEHGISSLIVVDDSNKPKAIIHLHHLLRAGLV